MISVQGRKGFFSGLIYQEGQSLLHRTHPLVNLMLLICFSITAFITPSAAGMSVLLVVLLLAYWAADLGFGFYLRKLRFILFFGSMIFAAQLFWVKEGSLLWTLQMGSLTLQIWSEGLWGGLRIALRFINVIGASYLFVSVTNPNRLAYALMQAGLPYRAGFMLITALRFIPLFHQELAQIRNAQMAKGIDLEGLSPGKLVRSVKYLLVPLVITVLGRVDTLTVSMEIRAFGLHDQREYLETQRLTRKERIILVALPVVFSVFAVVFFRKG
jgi:energy-coupling factor transport system permease protein